MDDLARIVEAIEKVRTGEWKTFETENERAIVNAKMEDNVMNIMITYKDFAPLSSAPLRE